MSDTVQLQLIYYRWGIKNEDTAIQSYAAIASKQHMELEIKKCGLFIHPQMPFLGASPDGIITCKCHACADIVTILEFKCPFKFKDGLPTQIMKYLQTYVCIELRINGH